MNDGYSICFNEWALDKDINGELGLLLIISSLCAEKGYCYASNEYLSKLFNTTETTITRKLRKLKEKNYITVEYKKRGSEIIERNIRLTKMYVDHLQSCKSTTYTNVRENNTSTNNKNNNKKENIKEKRFKKPTLEEIQEYCKARGNNIDPQRFYDYYETDNWKDVKNWKKKLITWEMHQPKTKEQKERDKQKEFEDMCKRLAYLDEE